MGFREIQKKHSGKGVFSLIYGETGVGKTYTTLTTLPQPILLLETEPRATERTLGSIVDKIDMKIFHVERFEEVFDYIAEEGNEISKQFASVFEDSTSYLMNVILLGEIEDETSEAGVFRSGKGERPLVNMGRTDWTGYGSVSSLMKRHLRHLGNLSKKGVVVVCSALLQNDPKWNRELSAAPAFVTKDFPRDLPAFFDLIGLVEPNPNKNDGYPPIVHFNSQNGNFMAKWTGNRQKMQGELNWKKILKSKGEE